MERKEFFYAFQISKLVTFYVNYYRCGNNKDAYFTTNADVFIRSKRGICEGGQCQEDVLPENSAAYRFYKKWDGLHLQDLTDKQYTELMEDIEVLKGGYNYIVKERPSVYPKPGGRYMDDYLRFDDVVEMSKLKPKKAKYDRKVKEAS